MARTEPLSRAVGVQTETELEAFGSPVRDLADGESVLSSSIGTLPGQLGTANTCSAT